MLGFVKLTLSMPTTSYVREDLGFALLDFWILMALRCNIVILLFRLEQFCAGSEADLEGIEEMFRSNRKPLVS